MTDFFNRERIVEDAINTVKVRILDELSDAHRVLVEKALAYDTMLVEQKTKQYALEAELEQTRAQNKELTEQLNAAKQLLATVARMCSVHE